MALDLDLPRRQLHDLGFLLNHLCDSRKMLQGAWVGLVVSMTHPWGEKPFCLIPRQSLHNGPASFLLPFGFAVHSQEAFCKFSYTPILITKHLKEVKSKCTSGKTVQVDFVS